MSKRGIFSIVCGAVVLASSLGTAAPATAAFSGPNGRVAYERNGDIYTVRWDGTSVSRLTSTGDNYDPQFSPDGLKVAFESDRSGDWDVYVMNSDGTNVRDLTAQPKTDVGTPNDLEPTWSPSGTQIAFISDLAAYDKGWYDRCNPFAVYFPDSEVSACDVYVMSADGSSKVNLTNLGLDEEGYVAPAWSPDGARIAYNNGEGELYVSEATGRSVTNVTPLSTTAENASWSPDGSHLAFDDGYDLYTMTPSGSGVKQLTHSGGVTPAWSPDGGSILYAKGSQFYVVRSDGTNPRLFLNGSYPYIETPDWGVCPSGANCGSPIPPSVDEVTASPEIFTPDQDGRQDSTMIRFSLSVDADVVVEIWNASGASVFSSQLQHLNSGSHSFTWSGQTSSHRVAPAGKYEVIITATDSDGVAGSASVQVALEQKIGIAPRWIGPIHFLKSGPQDAAAEFGRPISIDKEDGCIGRIQIEKWRGLEIMFYKRSTQYQALTFWVTSSKIETSEGLTNVVTAKGLTVGDSLSTVRHLYPAARTYSYKGKKFAYLMPDAYPYLTATINSWNNVSAISTSVDC